MDGIESPWLKGKQSRRGFCSLLAKLRARSSLPPLGSLGFHLPTQLLTGKACNSWNVRPKHDVNLFAVNLLDHCDTVTQHCHAVARFQGALLLATDVVLLACLDKVVQCRVEAGVVLPQRNSFAIVQ